MGDSFKVQLCKFIACDGGLDDEVLVTVTQLNL
jgi:hypothetical protein